MDIYGSLQKQKIQHVKGFQVDYWEELPRTLAGLEVDIPTSCSIFTVPNGW